MCGHPLALWQLPPTLTHGALGCRMHRAAPESQLHALTALPPLPEAWQHCVEGHRVETSDVPGGM